MSIKALLYSHFFLALCAFAMVMETAIVFNVLNREIFFFGGFVFFSTIIAYNIKGFLAVLHWDEKVTSDKILWALKNKRIFLLYCFLSFVLAVGFLWKVSSRVYLILFPLTILAISYSFPFKFGKYLFSPRNIPFMKTFQVALVWLIIVVYLPCYLNGIVLSQFCFWLVGEFIFLFSLAILFDIKDVRMDELHGIKTFPQVVGLNVIKRISLLLMAGRILLIFYFKPSDLLLMGEVLFSFLYLSFVVRFVNTERREWFYMLWVDGLMLGKLFLVSFYKYYNVV